MPETNDTYRTPEIIPSELEHGAYFDLHQGSADLISLESVRLAREAMSLASSSAIHPSLANTSQQEAEPTISPLEKITHAAHTVIAARKERIDSTIELHADDKTPHTSFIKKTIGLITGVEAPKLFVRPTNERCLLQAESKIGGQLFGEVSAYTDRVFFCLDESTWIWYEEQQNVETGKQTAITTRYEIHPNGILKAQEGSQYSYLEGEELENLALATQLYADRVLAEVYSPLKAAA